MKCHLEIFRPPIEDVSSPSDVKSRDGLDPTRRGSDAIYSPSSVSSKVDSVLRGVDLLGAHPAAKHPEWASSSLEGNEEPRLQLMPSAPQSGDAASRSQVAGLVKGRK